MYTHVCACSERVGGRETEREGRKEGGKGTSIAEMERRVVSKERQSSREGPNDRLKGKESGIGAKGAENITWLVNTIIIPSMVVPSCATVNIVNRPLQGSISPHRCRSWSSWSGFGRTTFWMR